jgi:RNA polymerase sigma factor (sigma-70 family)
MKTISGTESVTDEQLVEWSLTGDREAFGRIVERYQALVCSITYGATGSLSLSEDIAQETFVTAWRKLQGLGDATKLRAWLCGIARNLVNNSLRRGQREPVHAAEPLDAFRELPATEPSPAAEAVSREEEAILWRALERIPDSYREPLILFYRQQQSIERVAKELELSEDAVKQRLSRGRKLLAEEVLAFVEGTLRRTTPGKAFTLGVLATLPGLTLSAKAATLGATAAKGSAMAKAAAATGLLGAVLSPLLFFVGSYAGYRMRLEEIRSDEERNHLRSFYRRIGAFVSGIFIGFAALVFWLCRAQPDHSLLVSLLVIGLMVIYLLTTFAFAAGSRRRQRAYYSRVLAQECGGDFPAPAWEYRSKFSLLGLPLIHIRIGDRFDVLRGPVRAWIAVGNYAVGALFAFGGLAVAPASIGFCAVGLLPFGGVALGLLALGGVGIGVWTFGGLVVGWQALGGCAIAWSAAVGGIAWAHDFALGGLAHATQANNQAAKVFIESSQFFRCMRAIIPHSVWLNLFWVVPLVVQWRIVARTRRRTAGRTV